MKPINAEEIVRVFNGWLEEADSLAEREAIECCIDHIQDAEAAIRELHARGPEIERLYLDSKILPGELRALVMVSNCLEREFIHRQLATGQPLHMNAL